MKTFSITAGANTLEIDVIRHVRVDGSRFPAPDPDGIADYFLIDARLNGVIVDFYPGEGRPHDPLAFGFIGKKVVPVYALVSGIPEEGTAVYQQVGTKRGADFRSRFFRQLARRLGKAIRARALNKRIGQLTAADEASATGLLSRLLRGNFTDPTDLKAFSIDDACRFLRDAQGNLETGDKPPGTVATIDADFDSHATSGSVENETGTVVQVGINGSSVTFRGQFRFSLSSITAGSTINDSDYQVNQTTTSGVDVGDLFNLNQYGTSDPDTDAAATKYTNAGGTTYVNLTGCDTTGSKTADLGATADTDIGNQLSSPGWFTVGLAPGTGIIANEIPSFEAIENAGTDPATLTVDYTAPAATGHFLALMGVGV